MKRSVKLLSAIIALVCASVPMTAAAQTGGEGSDSIDKSEYGLAETIQEGTILHCFDWSYSDIEKELPAIAKAGFTSVQVSPAQTKYIWDGMVWYRLYQAGTFSLPIESDINTKADLESLCAEAEKYGIKIIMDVVGNHVGAIEDIPDELKADGCFRDTRGEIDYASRESITTGRVSGMPDLNTENPVVVKCVTDYLSELESVGVDGVRWDAAKHIALPSEGSEFWKTVTDNGLYHYGEILTGPTDSKKSAPLMVEYTEYMSVTDSVYSETVLKAFRNESVPESDGNWANRGVSADKLVYWGESHDTYSNDGQFGGSNHAEQNVIDRAYAVAAARADAASLYFSRPSETAKNRILVGEKGSMNFSHPYVSAVNHFHNAMIGKKDAYAASGGCAVITREGGGAVIVCGKDGGSVTVENAGGYAVPGTYIDEVSGNEFVITNETITGTVGDSGIAVLYDSPFIGTMYADPSSGTDIKGEHTVRLHCVSMTDMHYTLVRENRRGGVLSETAADFSDGSEIKIGGDALVGNVFRLTLTGTDISGREKSEVYVYNVPLENRSIEDNIYQEGYVMYDNINTCWDEVYIYACDETGGVKIENAAFPGEKMTALKSDWCYGYRLPDTMKQCKNIKITFSNGAGETVDNVKGESLVTEYVYYSAYYYDDYAMTERWITPAEFMQTTLLGDYDTDGTVTSSDALEILRISANMTENFHPVMEYLCRRVCDVDGDGEVTSSDALAVLRFSAGEDGDSAIGKTIRPAQTEKTGE